jgi:hypothetical protein
LKSAKTNDTHNVTVKHNAFVAHDTPLQYNK